MTKRYLNKKSQDSLNKSLSFFEKKSKKSQAVVIDLFVTLFIFVIVLSIILISWNKYNYELGYKVAQKDMWLTAFHISDILVSTPGDPNNWELVYNKSDVSGSIRTLGLAEFDRELTKSKILNFSDLSNVSKKNYTDVKELLNIEGYDFYFRLVHRGSEELYSGGLKPSFYGATRTTSIRRYVNYEECFEGRCMFEFVLWN